MLTHRSGMLTQAFFFLGGNGKVPDSGMLTHLKGSIVKSVQDVILAC